MAEAENVPPSSYFGGLRQSAAYSRGNMDAAQGLPREFVKSMETLFDMLDDSGTGEVALSEIERRWRDDAVPNLPGVLDALRVVAPSKGLLTFNSFVSGLRLALHRSRNQKILKTCNEVPKYERSDPGFHNKFPTYPAEFKKPISYDTRASTIPSFSSDTGGALWHSSRPFSAFGGHENNSRPDRRFRHRRSNSGPIFTAKVLPNMKQPHLVGLLTRDDLKLNSSRPREENTTNRSAIPESRKQTAIAFGARGFTNNMPRSESKCLNADPDPVLDKQISDLDQITASTLFIDEDGDSSQIVSVQPIVVSGKYIGITGTLNRAKSSTSISQRRYGSLPRPPSKENHDYKASPVASSSLSSLSTTSRLRECKGDGITSEFWRSECSGGSSGIYRKRTSHKGESVRGRNSASTINILRSGYGRRCNSASPPEVPAYKSARSSSCDENGVLSGRGHSALTTSPDSSASSTYSSPGNEDSGMVTLQTRADSASRARRRRNARWNTVVGAFDSPMMKYLKELQQKEDLVTKGLASIDLIKKCFEKGLAKTKHERDELNAKVENCWTSHPSSTSAKGTMQHRMQPKNDFLQPSDQDFGSLSSAIACLGQVVKEFQEVEWFTDLDVPCDTVTDSNFRVHNILLEKEVSSKSDRIAQLEKEKAALVRQLFQARSEMQQSAGCRTNTSIFI